MSFVGNVHVPEELNDGSKQDNTDSTKVFDTRFTTEFESAVVFGTISIVEDKNEKVMGLRLISEKYVPKDMTYFDKAVDVSYNVTYVLRLDIQHITGKRKKYDKEGIEMKWGRME
jgi:hypothetical protein